MAGRRSGYQHWLVTDQLTREEHGWRPGGLFGMNASGLGRKGWGARLRSSGCGVVSGVFVLTVLRGIAQVAVPYPSGQGEQGKSLRDVQPADVDAAPEYGASQ